MTTELNKAIAGVQDVLVTDLKGIVGEADKLLNEVACATAEDFAAARTKIAEKLDDAKSKLDSTRVAVTKNARCAAEATQEYVVNNPWRVLGTAAAVGVLIGILISRR